MMFSPELQPPHPYQSPSPSIASLHPHLRPPQQCSPGEVLGASPELGSEADSGDLVISSSFQMAAGSVSKESTHEKSVSESCLIDPNWGVEGNQDSDPNDQCKSLELTLSLEVLVGCSFSFNFSAVVGWGFCGVNLLEDWSWWLWMLPLLPGNGEELLC